MPAKRLLNTLETLSKTEHLSEEFKSVLQLLKISLNSTAANLDTITSNMSGGFAHCKIICNDQNIPIDYKFIEINKAFTVQTGLEEKNVIGKTVLEIYPDLEKSWIALFGNVALKQKPATFTEYNHNTKKHYATSAYSNAPGEFIMLINDVTQIEALKKAETVAKEVKKINSDILANMAEAFSHCQVLYNEEGIANDFRILEVNKAYTTHTGIPREAIIGKTMLEFFPDVEQSWLDTFIEVALSQQPKSFIDYNHNTGKYYDMNAYAPEKGFFVIIFKDITEKEADRRKLEESENSKSQLLNHLTAGFAHCEIICNDKGQPIDYRILDVNSAYEKQTGIMAKDIVGKTVLEIFPDIEPSWIHIYGNVALNQKTHSFIDFNHNTGKYYETDAYCPKKGEFALIFKDVTAQENKRELLEKAYRKASESERLKSAFLANMSHEIRTPMNAILGCSALLEDKNLGEEEKIKCLAHINTSGNRLLTLISDIVDISKIDAQQQVLKFREQNLNKLLTGIKEQFEVTNSNSNITLHLENGLLNEMSAINTDDSKLAQILSNLLENAFKFTHKGKIIFGYSLKEDFLHFYVKDSGIGIKPEEHQTIFKRFGQVLDAQTKINSGSGLGISIVKGLVELFGGEICLDSVFGKGSTFYFTLPYLPIKKEISMTKTNFTVLIAEDDDINFYLLNTWINDFCTIIHAKDGIQAIKKFQAHPEINLIIMDIRMPYMNGIDATKEIRKSNPTIPILAHTAYAMNDESDHMLEAGCNEIITKPIKKEVLIGIIQKYKNKDVTL